MNRRTFLQAATGVCASALRGQGRIRPNIVVILSDDVGYGDLGSYGATKVKTPNLDRLASQGMRFTDAHSTSATCTPSRYSLMTGEYTWRKKGTGILPGDAALIVDPSKHTLPSMMKQAGYATAAIGKWHLGLGNGKIDWNGEIKPGPLELGFDYSFIIPATGDRVPCVYVEGRRVAGLDPKDPIQVSYGARVGKEPTGKEHPEMLKMKLSQGHDQTIVNGISRIGYMTGGKSARWKDDEIAQTLARKADEFIVANRAAPFFIYLATHDIHVPRVPNVNFAGQSACGVRCDAIQQLDWTVGQVLNSLEKAKILHETLLIFTSDNGPVVDDGYADGSVERLNGHTPAGPLRGGKYSIYEGGTRVPFIASWPMRIRTGVTDALISQVDLVATLGAVAGVESWGPDSVNILPALLGTSRMVRESLVEHSGGLALRQGLWKFIPGKESSGPELYNLGDDLGEKHNLAAQQGARVQEMTAALERVQMGGR